MKLDDYLRFNQLYDLYRQLLTEHQQRIVSMYIRDDLSLFEIAEKMQTSRQAVSDTLATAKAHLENYESKLELLERISVTKRAVATLEEMLVESGDEVKRALYEINNAWQYVEEV